MENKIIEISDLTIKYQQKEILKKISLFLNKGEILGLIGESGSGKTTIGKSIVNLIKKNNGEIFVRTSSQNKVQMIFQNPYSSLDSKMNISKILTLGMKINKLYPGREIQRATELLEMCGLPKDFLLRYPYELSGGQRQRVGIARALSTNPEILIADEPTSALDVTTQFQILELLFHLKKKYNLSIIFISHDLNIVKKICDRVYILYQGEILEEGNPKNIFNSPKSDYTKKLLDSIPIKHPRDREIWS